MIGCIIYIPSINTNDAELVYIVWHDATRASSNLVTRSQRNGPTKMAVLDAIAGSENRLISFFQRIKSVLAEAEQCICAVPSNEDIDALEIFHERLSEVGQTVFILMEFSNLDGDLEMERFHRIMDELCTHLTRLRIYFENITDALRESTFNYSAFPCERIYTGLSGQPKLDVSKRQIELLRELHFPWVRIAELLGVSIKTIIRRRREFQMDDMGDTSWCSIEDGKLRELMQQIMNVTPGIGQSRMLGALHSRNIGLTTEYQAIPKLCL